MSTILDSQLVSSVSSWKNINYRIWSIRLSFAREGNIWRVSTLAFKGNNFFSYCEYVYRVDACSCLGWSESTINSRIRDTVQRKLVAVVITVRIPRILRNHARIMNGKLFSPYSVDVRLSRRAFIVFKVHRRGCRNSTIRRKVHMHEQAYPCLTGRGYYSCSLVIGIKLQRVR